MPLTFRRTLRLGKHLSLNLGKRGVSASVRAGRVSVNSSGSLAVRLLRGIGWRIKL